MAYWLVEFATPGPKVYLDNTDLKFQADPWLAKRFPDEFEAHYFMAGHNTPLFDRTPWKSILHTFVEDGSRGDDNPANKTEEIL